MRLRSLILAAVLLSPLCGCETQDTLAEIRAAGELVVVTRNSPTTYYLDQNGPTGFEYALTELLAAELGVELKIETVFNLHDLFETLRRQEANIAAAGLTLTKQRAALYPHSTSYYKLTPEIIYVAGNTRPRSIDDLDGMKIVTLADSSHAERLRSLQKHNVPGLAWEEIDEADTMALLERLKRGQAELAIIDSNEFAVQQSMYPRQKIAFSLGREQDMVWYLPPDTDNTRLLAFIDAFLQRLQEDGTLLRLREQYFGHTEGVSRISAHVFSQNMRQNLPPYRALIKHIANEYQMDWHLLAAMAYQESHWNPKATSPTGVRGMMMLTKPTARELGVDNRLDPAQSLRGGARYLKNIKRRLAKRIEEPDRTWMALAAYNVGLGHLEDARILTERQDGNPDLWQDVMERLPLLQQSKYHKTTRYGYARGLEAVTLVQNIRHYYSILAWQDISDNQPLPPLPIEDYFPDAIQSIDLQAL